ncbi:patatin-like protein [Croceicoccus naphthovorans]|uniref:Patatin n=1 Tax=Croceicoccus naphthovorans TaxID=1348774 RepID=A0A0G3XEL6_9SPHN|nr:patatin-like protein [Croceicoccus naphthovorans]AKM10015.1 patatin [Croceicoccus naphthovorans]MBB3991104.1 patatin-related protein [Croceicoccus naphthovorans]
MREKELRIALVCYGGVSLAVYMHGVTKEVLKLAEASRAFREDEPAPSGSPAAYHRLLQSIRRHGGTRLRIVPDILSGTSAGGMNAVFLAQALLTGRSLDPLTRLWLDCADSDVLLAPEARPGHRFSKIWAQPLVEWALRRPGNAVSRTVAPETRAEVRAKLSRLMRSRWFAPPFSGIVFSRLIDDALTAMRDQPPGQPLVPEGHPLDLFVTTTDFRGYRAPLHVNSPADATEAEHRLSISFRAHGGEAEMAARPELVMAARATASFPGAFPPLVLSEIDELAEERWFEWPGRDLFLRRIMPHHVHAGDLDSVALIDGAVLVGAPFAQAISALENRPASREVDRRFVYIDPHPDFRLGGMRSETRPIGFFTAIFGALSSIPREQPIRDDLERIARHSADAMRIRGIIDALRPEVEATVDKLLGRTLFLNRPNADRLTKWRRRAQQAAAERAGFAFHSYAQAKYAGILDGLANLICRAIEADPPEQTAVVSSLMRHFEAQGLVTLAAPGGGANDDAIAFFRMHDIGFRTRRLRLMARRLAPGDIGGELEPETREIAREAIYKALSLYRKLEQIEALGRDFAGIAEQVLTDPRAVLTAIAEKRNLKDTDPQVDSILADGLSPLPREQRRKLLLTYLGFPFYDIATLPLLGARGLDEFDPIKVDRISPEDASTIRPGGAVASLRGIEFYNFGAFFSRAYRENDYLWGRLHGAERLIDITASTLAGEGVVPQEEIVAIKREAFLAILEEERQAKLCRSGLIERLETEVRERLG